MLDQTQLEKISELTGLPLLVKEGVVGFAKYHRINHGMKLGIAMNAVLGYDVAMFLANIAKIGTQDMEQIIFWRIP